MREFKYPYPNGTNVVHMTDKRVKVDEEQLDELLTLGNMAKMGFVYDSEAVRWAINKGIDTLRQAIVTRKSISRDDAAPVQAEA